MKKVLSLVLAFALILGSFGFVFANQYPDVKDTETYSEPVNVLSGLGVVGGFPDGTFQPDGKVTRAQMATMLINCLGIPVSGKADTPFSDVPASHWASGFIKYAANMGYVAGYADGTFKPDKEVSYDEALTMIVASLGYTSEGLTGSWPGNFVNAARGLGILSICKTTGSAAATRADVCCFLYKALTSPIGRTNKDGEFIKTVTGQDDHGKDIYDTMIGRLGAVDYAPGGAGTEGDPFVVTGDEDSDVNLGEYIGACITAYADDSNTIIAIKEVKSQFVEDTIKNIKKTYSKTDAAVWAASADYFENGEEAGTAAVDAFSDSDFVKVAVGLKNAKAVDEVYSIQAWWISAADFAADDVQDDINDDHELLGIKFAEDEDGEIDLNSFVLLGRDSLADIAEDDVVYVYANSKPEITKIEVGTETVEGKIAKIDTAKGTYTIGGKAYGYGAGAAISEADLKTAMTDKASGTFYLDYAGDIYDFEAEAAETSDGYAIVLRAWNQQKEDVYTDYIEFFTADGSVVKYESDGLFAGYEGELVKYTLEDDVVTALATALGTDAEWAVSKNGLYSGNKISSSTVIIKFSGDPGKLADLKASKNYEVVAAADVFGEKIQKVDYVLDGTNVKAILYRGVADTAAAELAFFAEEGELTPEGAMWTILNNGKVEELNVKSSVTIPSYPTDPVTLTMKDDVVTGAADASSKILGSMSVPNLDTKKISYSGNVFTSTDGTNYDMASDIIVYVCDSDGAWKVGSKSALNAKADKLTDVIFYETTDDGAFDIVFVFEK